MRSKSVFGFFALIMVFAAEGKSFALFAGKYDNAGSIKGTVRAVTGGTNGESTFISGARLTLTNRALPNFLLKTVTDDSGSFIFNNLPAGKYTLTAEADNLPSATREIDLASGAVLTVEINLTVEVSEAVTVRDEEGLLSTSETATSNVVRSETLKSQPLRAENYQAALPLTPGVINDANGNNYLKGTRAGQSNYTVNGADVTDPVTGQSSFAIPLEAASSVQIEENPYSAEFGHFTGGVTNLQTKGGGDKFKISAARFFPTFHNIFSTQLDSFRPRLTLSGPLVKNRLYFLQSFEYRFTRSFVPSLMKPQDNSLLEAFESFTQFDWTINKNNILKFNFALFPQKVRFANLDTFNPPETTPNTKQRGLLFSISEQSIFRDASFLASAISYKTSDADVLPQDVQPFTVTPETNRGSYFADTRRSSRRLQLQETYYAHPFDWRGQHSLKIGFEFDRTKINGQFRYHSIFLRRLDNTLAQKIDFTNPAPIGYGYTEVGAFVQDRLVVNPKLTLDAGIRFDRDNINQKNNLAPRFSFLFLPFKNNRTIVRGGVGLFFDRTLPGAGYFDEDFSRNSDNNTLNDSDNPSARVKELPERIVTNFAPDGVTVTDGPRYFNNEVAGKLQNPRSLRWSLQLDRGITKNLIFRIGFLQRRTTHDLLVEPITLNANAGALELSSRGRSRYRELQLLATYNRPNFGSWNASYVWSSARGDLNTADKFLGDFPAFVVRPNEFGRLPFDAPHRFLFYGQIDAPYEIRISPLFEARSGFPFSAVNERLDFVGARNQAGRFPKYISLDLQVTKRIAIPFFSKYHARVGVALFNLTNHFNPRDVQNNIASPNYGKFYNSLGVSVRAKFDIDF